MIWIDLSLVSADCFNLFDICFLSDVGSWLSSSVSLEVVTLILFHMKILLLFRHDP